MKTERLDKYIASRSEYSRKDVKSMLRDGRIRVNGAPVRDGSLAVSEADTVEIDRLPFAAPKHIYLMLFKPAGIVSASEDRHEKTVIDLIPAEWRRDSLFPAGRLDKDTTGFVLITNDGDFAHNILSPKKHVSKTYLVTLRDPAQESYVQVFQKGVVLGDGTQCLSADLEFTDDPYVVRIRLHEGRYHQVKRMFASLGNAVAALHREAIGGVLLDERLKPGECRPLLDTELRQLQQK